MLEMIIAVTIFAGIVVALMGVWAMHARAVAHSRGTLMATHLAERLVEEALSEGWMVSPKQSDFTTRYTAESLINGQKTTTVFDWTREVLPRSTPDGGRYKLLRVKVTWEEGGKNREVDLDTVVTWQG